MKGYVHPALSTKEKTHESRKGWVQVYTGKGKGKTTARG